MEIINIIAILISLSAIFGYINHRFIKLPATIGILFIALLISLLLLVAGSLGFQAITNIQAIIKGIDFNETLMHGMLSFLLFAGALQVNLDDLTKQKGVILSLATAGVVATTFIIGFGSWWLLSIMGISVSFIYCLLFGALISPTDPVAVMGILKSAGAPKSLEIKIVGESLFNDGVAVVMFLVILGLVSGGHDVNAGGIALLFAQEVIGGVIYGLIVGYVGYSMLKSVNDFELEILITLAMVMGGYALATVLHLSGPLAMVIAGLMIGNHGRMFAMTNKTREHIDHSWHLIDSILNTILFLLIGLEVLAISTDYRYLLIGALMIPLVLLSRFMSVGLMIGFMRKYRRFTPGVVKILTWGGLRGGVSIALALSMPRGDERDLFLTATYIVVIFAVLVQGLTIGGLVRKSAGSGL
ncbi:MAG TPA: sodium:proton antiporter [Gammaproteobacteria bacterium]